LKYNHASNQIPQKWKSPKIVHQIITTRNQSFDDDADDELSYTYELHPQNINNQEKQEFLFSMPLLSRLDLFTIENINGFEMHFSYALSQPPIFDFNVFSSM